MWSRTVNTHGQAGRIISCDIHMEHLNRQCKQSLGSLGPNVTNNAVDRIGRCVGEIVKATANYDMNNKVTSTSGEHSIQSTMKDMDKLLEQLNKNSIFVYQKGRSHKQFEKHKKMP